MDKLENALKSFFISLKQHVLVWHSLLDQSKRPLEAFCNQAEQLQLVLRAEWKEDVLKKFPDLKSRLHYKIRSGIESELQLLKNIRGEMEKRNKELMKKMDLVERATLNIDLSALTSKGYIAPPVYTLLEYAEDAHRYFISLMIIVNGALQEIRYENEKSVEALKNAFTLQHCDSEKIDEIQNATRYFIQDKS